MCGPWLPFVPFVLVGAYIYWWQNLRQYNAKYSPGCIANIIWLASVGAMFFYLFNFCAKGAS